MRPLRRGFCGDPLATRTVAARSPQLGFAADRTDAASSARAPPVASGKSSAARIRHVTRDGAGDGVSLRFLTSAPPARVYASIAWTHSGEPVGVSDLPCVHLVLTRTADRPRQTPRRSPGSVR